MEEHVIQETPVANPDQPVAAADTAPQQPDPAPVKLAWVEIVWGIILRFINSLKGGK